MFSIIAVHEQGDASLHNSGIKSERAAKMQRGKLVKKYDFEAFVIVEDNTAELRISELNSGKIRVSEDGQSFTVVPTVQKTTAKKTASYVGKTVPANILHMISVTTGPAHQQWVNIATRNYGYKAGV